MGIKAALPRYELYLYSAVLGLAMIWAASWILEVSSCEYKNAHQDIWGLGLCSREPGWRLAHLPGVVHMGPELGPLQSQLQPPLNRVNCPSYPSSAVENTENNN